MFGLKWFGKKLSGFFQGSAKADPNSVSVQVKDIIHLFYDDATLNEHHEKKLNSMDLAKHAFDLMKQLSCTYAGSNPSSLHHVDFNIGLDALKHSLPINTDDIDSTATTDRETLERLYDAVHVVDPALRYLNNMRDVITIHKGPLQDDLRGETYGSAYQKLKSFDENLRSFLYQHDISSYQHKMDMAEQARMAEDQYRAMRPPPSDFDPF